MICISRPVKWRKIEHIPTITYFVPTDNSAAGFPVNPLKLEELEAVRLKDLEGLEQEECAGRMGVSRPTFQRILLSAREKIADSLINGKVIHIEGGSFTQNICPVRCSDCGNEWVESYENLEVINESAYTCPACGSKKFNCGNSCSGKFGRGNCWRHGRMER